MLYALFATLLLQQEIPTDPAERFQRRVTPEVQVVQACKPAVVFIQTEIDAYRRDSYMRIFKTKGAGEGSGVVVKKQGFIITNYHVVKGANKITISFASDVDDKPYEADVVSFVEEEDLALLKIRPDKADPNKEFPTIQLGTSSDLMLGERVIAIGNPYGQTHTVSEGLISGLHRNVEIKSAGLSFEDLIQTDASINFGNSGGPLININGEMIGINSSMNTEAQNIGFAIPVDRVKTVLQYRLTSPDAARTWLGFEVENLQISKVVPKSPAALANLHPGDCIVAIGGQPVRNNEEYRLARIALAPDQDVDLKFDRGGRTQSVKLRSWEAVDGMIFQRLGLKCDEVVLGRERRVRVLEVATKDSPAGRLGLEAGDIFTAVRVQALPVAQAYQIYTKENLAEVLNARAKPGAQIEVEIYRDLNGDNRYTRDELHRGSLTVE